MIQTLLRYRFLFFLFAASLLLGSCKLGKHYTRPQLELPETLDSLSVDTTSIGDYAWEQLYTDTTLQALIRKTLTYNKDMLIAAARVKQLAAQKRIDYANMFPQVGLRVYGEHERENYGGDHVSMDDQFDLKGTVAWELDVVGETPLGKRPQRGGICGFGRKPACLEDEPYRTSGAILF